VDDHDARRARVFGAFGVLGKARLEHQDFMELLREASRTQQRALADWRVSEAATQSRRFGAVRIPGYRCIRRLAGGSVSQLFLAESEKAGALIVVKVTPSMRDESGVDQSFERFLQEYEIARRLHHSNLVRCYELGVADDHAYLAMEYFPEGDLRRRMRLGLSTDEALAYALQIARALNALHGAGALHRDLKPGNVLMRGNGRIALSDFGLAKHISLEFEITDPGLIFGTPHYMSPEQGHGQDVDARTDIYSLGIILYEMLAGEKPYTDANPMAIIYKHRNSPIPRLPAASAALQPLVDKLLAKEPHDRYATAAEVESAIAAQIARTNGVAA
jgi:serine/threonine protein kinase